MSDNKYVVKKQCGACLHLIFKDHKHHEGRCSISGWDMHFEDICLCYEYIDNPDNLRKVTWRLNNGTTTEC